ncbi:MAG TPA: ArsC family reductase [Burkholderiales bacterium]|nr:ArsC family reductase [Burkholderiales bacterium]
MTKIYGIRNCDTMKKAFAWLDGHKVCYEFHDYKSAGIDLARLKAWSKQVGWEVLLNTRGTTWRRLSPQQQAGLDGAKALRLMSEHPSLIKRSVLEHGASLLVGFDPQRYTNELAR